jgi:hypothetical protein
MTLAVLDMTTVGSGNSTGGWTKTVVVDVTDTGVRPGIGRRLCRSARGLVLRLSVAIGIAGIAWLLGTVLSAGTASAAEAPPPASDTSSGLLGVVGSITGSLTDTVTGLTDTVTDVTDTATDTVTGTVTSVVAPPAKSVVVPVVQHSIAPVRTAVRHTVSRANRVTAVRHTVHRATTVVPQRKSLARAIPRRIARSVHHRPAPLRAPSPAPQAPSPVLPSGSANAAHTGASGLAVHVPASAAPALVSAGGWTADPATLAARNQCLPTASPD